MRPHYQDGAVGVAHHGVSDAAHKRPPYTAEAPAAYNYEASTDVLGQVDYRFVPPFAHLQVGDRNRAADLFYPSKLFVEYVLGLLSEIPASRFRFGVAFVDARGKGASDRDDVELRTRHLGELDRR